VTPHTVRSCEVRRGEGSETSVTSVSLVQSQVLLVLWKTEEPVGVVACGRDRRRRGPLTRRARAQLQLRRREIASSDVKYWTTTRAFTPFSFSDLAQPDKRAPAQRRGRSRSRTACKQGRSVVNPGSGFSGPLGGPGSTVGCWRCFALRYDAVCTRMCACVWCSGGRALIPCSE
jgi:hypothetical protein